MARFEGFGPQALAFFKALAFHQNRDWFEANRALYESDVSQPAGALIEDLAERFAEAGGRKGALLTGDAKRSLFRNNRDVRFSKDKSPYKTHLGAVMTRSGGKNDPGLLYINIAPEGCFIATGFYHLEPPQLLRMRKAIRAPKKFSALEAALAKSKLELSDEEQMTRLPRGFEAEKGGPLEGALRMRNFIVREAVADKAILKPALAQKVFDFAMRSEPLLQFGWKALG